MQTLKGLSAIITGGASGIGAATVRLLAAEGALVAVADLNGEAAERVAAEVVAAGGTAIAVHTDVSNEDSIAALVATTVEQFGGVGLLHNNAAILGGHRGSSGPIHDIDLRGWETVFKVNVRGVMLGTKHVLPHMLAAGSGVIVNSTSSSDHLGDLDATYASTKGAVSAFTRATAAQYGKHGIRCNAIAPGMMVHDENRPFIDDEMLDIYLKHHLTTRLGTGEDIGRMVAFLATDAASFITGQVIGVDGGLATHLPYVGDYLRLGRVK